MQKTTKGNIVISQAIENTLGITFSNEEFKLDKWGNVDNWCHLSYDTLILLECEKGQRHPTTNVLKLYPYLREYSKIHVVLFHYFFPENKAPKNRLALCNFLGEILETEFGIRFQYVPLKGKLDELEKELIKHKRKLMQMIASGKKIKK
jgi:hypothetical protein